MKLSLIGYGKMGHVIERIAKERGHEVLCIIDISNTEDFGSEAFRMSDVAIEFTTPQTAALNIRRSWSAGVPVVCGTTGWYDALPELKNEAEQQGYGLFCSSNFSIGVNVFAAINKRLAELMSAYPQYAVSMKEIHHVHKLDAPSGTAVMLADAIGFPKEKIVSVREGEVAGTHIVRYESEADTLEIRHEAKSRDGFAFGAVIAAEFMQGKKGSYDMNDLLWAKG